MTDCHVRLCKFIVPAALSAWFNFSLTLFNSALTSASRLPTYFCIVKEAEILFIIGFYSCYADSPSATFRNGFRLPIGGRFCVLWAQNSLSDTNFRRPKRVPIDNRP